MRSRDTSAAAHERQLARVRALSPAERFDALARMSEDARLLALAGIRARHPEYDDAEARHALHRLLYGDDLFHRAWPRAPRLAP